VYVAEQTREIEEMKRSYHHLGPFGWHGFSEKHVSTFSCPFDFHDMPFDVQQCKLHFTVSNLPPLPATPANDAPVRLIWNPFIDPVNGKNTTAAEWDITEPTQWTVAEKYVMEPQPLGVINTSVLVVSFEMSRQPYHFIDNFVVPAILIYIVSFLGLWIDPKAVPARAFAAFVPVIIQSERITALGAKLPAISYQTRLKNFMTFTLLMNVLHVFEFAIVHRVHLMTVRADQRDEAPADNTSANRHKAQVFSCLNRWLGFHFKWVSPLVFTIVTSIIFLR